MGKKAPKAPDPWATAQAQGKMNRETAITEFGLNAYTQNNPWGTTSWEQTGNWDDGTPRFEQTTTFSPEQQAIWDKSQQAESNLAGLASDQSAMLQDYLGNPFEFTNRDAETWAYDLASPRILQQQGQNESTLRTALANKGIREGSAAWDAEMARMTNANSDQLNQLALTGRQQGFSEALAQRNQPINEITALLSGSQVSNPAQMNASGPQVGVGGVDYAGLVGQNYQNQLQAHQNQMGGIGGLFGSVLGAAGQAGGFGALFSDRRLKTDIQRIGQTDGGLPLYSYRYIDGGPVQIGVMADEAQAVFPDAVIEDASGFLKVDYGRIR